MPIDEKRRACYSDDAGRESQQERKQKGGQTEKRTSRTQRGHRRRVLERQHAPRDTWGDTPDRTRNRRDDMSADTSLKYDFKGGEHVKSFFKCTAIVLAVIAFGLALSAIVH